MRKASTFVSKNGDCFILNLLNKFNSHIVQTLNFVLLKITAASYRTSLQETATTKKTYLKAIKY